MRWETVGACDDSAEWIEAKTPVGEWAITNSYGMYVAIWYPAGLRSDTPIGSYRTEGAAKGACKRYAKKLAAAFKAMGKTGWQ